MSTTLTRRTCTCYRSTVNSTQLYFSTRPSITITVLSTVHNCTLVLGHLSQSQYCQQYTTVLQYSANYHNHSNVNSTQLYFSTRPSITITVLSTVHNCTLVLSHLSQSQYCQQYTTVLQYLAIYHNHSTVNSTQVYFSTQPSITITILSTVHKCTLVLGHLPQSQYCQQYTTVL